MKAKIVAVALLAMMSGSVMAQSKDQSLSIFGNYMKSSGSDAIGLVAGSYGFLPTPNIEVNVTIAAVFAEDTITSYGAGAKYYFGAVGTAGAMIPYLKAEVMSADSETMYGGGAGIEYGLSESAGLFIEALATKNSGSDSSGTVSRINLGLNYRF
jgi:hypothetical protein